MACDEIYSTSVRAEITPFLYGPALEPCPLFLNTSSSYFVIVNTAIHHCAGIHPSRYQPPPEYAGRLLASTVLRVQRLKKKKIMSISIHAVSTVPLIALGLVGLRRCRGKSIDIRERRIDSWSGGYSVRARYRRLAIFV